MKRSIQLAILTLLVVALPALAADGAPQATVEEPIVDLGTASQGEVIEATFVIANRGDAPLEIVQVRPACGCTVAEYDEVIAPGESGKIVATVDTKSLFGPNSRGVTVYTNDPQNPQLQLTIKSDVRPHIFAEPGYARFTTFVRGDRSQSSTQTVWTEDFENLEITGTESTVDWLEVSVRPTEEVERKEKGVGNQYLVEVTLAEDAPVGPVAQFVRLKVNHPKQDVLEIPVSGFVRPRVAVLPPSLDFGSVDREDPKKWGVLVRNFGSEPLELGDVVSRVDGLDVEIEALEEGRQYRVTFTPTGEMASGPFDGTVAIRTNLEEPSTIEVGVTGEAE